MLKTPPFSKMWELDAYDPHGILNSVLYTEENHGKNSFPTDQDEDQTNTPYKLPFSWQRQALVLPSFLAFMEIYVRMRFVTKCATGVALAKFLGVQHSEILYAYNHALLPARWLVHIQLMTGANLQWLLAIPRTHSQLPTEICSYYTQCWLDIVAAKRKKKKRKSSATPPPQKNSPPLPSAPHKKCKPKAKGAVPNLLKTRFRATAWGQHHKTGQFF